MPTTQTASLVLADIRAALAGTAYVRLCDDNAAVSRRTRVEVQGATGEHVAALQAAGYTVQVRETPVRNRDGAVIRTRRTVAVVAM